MTVQEWLSQAQRRLETVGIATARLDCLVLLEDRTDKDRSWLLAHPEYELQIEQVGKLNKQIARRASHEPLAYIRGKTEFYGREFIIDHHVLEPRPESEAIIDLLKTFCKDQPCKVPEKSIIIDVGTGSGALAITAKLEWAEAKVLAIDIDPKCLKVAKINVAKYHADVQLIEGNLLEPLHKLGLPGRNLTLLCNLPYVPDNFQISPATMREPRIAIFGGPDGLDLYRQLFEQIKAFKNYSVCIFAESMPPQHEQLAQLAKQSSLSLETTNDFIQLFKNLN